MTAWRTCASLTATPCSAALARTLSPTALAGSGPHWPSSAAVSSSVGAGGQSARAQLGPRGVRGHVAGGVVEAAEEGLPARVDAGRVLGVAGLQLLDVLGVLPLQERRGVEDRVLRLVGHGLRRDRCPLLSARLAPRPAAALVIPRPTARAQAVSLSPGRSPSAPPGRARRGCRRRRCRRTSSPRSCPRRRPCRRRRWRRRGPCGGPAARCGRR